MLPRLCNMVLDKSLDRVFGPRVRKYALLLLANVSHYPARHEYVRQQSEAIIGDLKQLYHAGRDQRHRQTDTQTERETHTHRQRERQTDGQRDRHTDRQTDRETDRHRQIDREADRRTDRQTDTDRRTDTRPRPILSVCVVAAVRPFGVCVSPSLLVRRLGIPSSRLPFFFLLRSRDDVCCDHVMTCAAIT